MQGSLRDESENIPVLVQRAKETFAKMNLSWEIIFITDANRDNTVEVLRLQNNLDERVKYLKLSRSNGQHVAVLAGLHHASGRYTVIMDGDLQDLPEDIPLLYQKILAGYDIVYGIKETKDESVARNIADRLVHGV